MSQHYQDALNSSYSSLNLGGGDGARGKSHNNSHHRSNNNNGNPPSRLLQIQQQFRQKILRDNLNTLKEIQKAKQILKKERRRSSKVYTHSPRARVSLGGDDQGLYQSNEIAPIADFRASQPLKGIKSRHASVEQRYETPPAQQQPSSFNTSAKLPSIGTSKSKPNNNNNNNNNNAKTASRSQSRSMVENNRYDSPSASATPEIPHERITPTPSSKGPPRKTKTQRQMEERKAKEEERKRQIEFRKQQRDELHSRRAEERNRLKELEDEKELEVEQQFQQTKNQQQQQQQQQQPPPQELANEEQQFQQNENHQQQQPPPQELAVKNSETPSDIEPTQQHDHNEPETESDPTPFAPKPPSKPKGATPSSSRVRSSRQPQPPSTPRGKTPPSQQQEQQQQPQQQQQQQQQHEDEQPQQHRHEGQEQQQPRNPTPPPTEHVVATVIMDENGAPIVLAPCSICGRKFNEQRLAKHTAICQKANTKKRAKFDQSKARIAGTDAAAFAQSAGKNEKKYEKAKKKTGNWRAKSEAFRAAMRAGKDPDAPPPPTVEDPNLVKCPCCSRTFNSDVAERHIPRCQESQAKANNRTNNKKGPAKKTKYDPRKVMKK